MNPILIDGVGALAALCSTASFFPQVVKLYREKDASAVSMRTYGVTVAAFGFWVVYGVALKSWPLVIANGVCVALSGAILALKIRYDRKREPKT